MTEMGASGCAVREVWSGLGSSGVLHVNDKRRKRREENT